MKKIDFKFWYIRRDDDVHISEAAIRFYEGDITTKDELDFDTRSYVPIRRYRRVLRLTAQDMSYLGNKPIRKELSGHDAIIFTPADFGVISTEAELDAFINRIIKDDPIRSRILNR